MSHIDGELERFEERPELDIHSRYALLLRRFQELEKLYYKLRRLEAPDPRQIIQRVFAEHSGSVLGETNMSVVPSSAHFKSRQPATQEYRGILSDVAGEK
jgi:hypothetical protein